MFATDLLLDQGELYRLCRPPIKLAREAQEIVSVLLRDCWYPNVTCRRLWKSPAWSWTTRRTGQVRTTVRS